ncbi:MAG TPA: DUF1918 domain-containing protein [Acidimicrobiales bacterium]
MTAQPGDRLIIRRLDVGAPPRDGEILEVHGSNGAPPYLVRWSDDGQEGLIFPGTEATIQSLKHIAAPRTSSNRPTASNEQETEER